jgi:hypothetical protein
MILGGSGFLQAKCLGTELGRSVGNGTAQDPDLGLQRSYLGQEPVHHVLQLLHRFCTDMSISDDIPPGRLGVGQLLLESRNLGDFLLSNIRVVLRVFSCCKSSVKIEPTQSWLGHEYNSKIYTEKLTGFFLPINLQLAS